MFMPKRWTAGEIAQLKNLAQKERRDVMPPNLVDLCPLHRLKRTISGYR
jgi:hypothetical protein